MLYSPNQLGHFELLGPVDCQEKKHINIRRRQLALVAMERYGGFGNSG